MSDLFTTANIISFISALVAVILLFHTFYTQYKRNRLEKLKVFVTLGDPNLSDKAVIKKLRLPIWTGIFGVPKFKGEEAFITIPIFVRNDSMVALKNIELTLTHPVRFSIDNSDNKLISELKNDISYPNDKIKRFSEGYFPDLTQTSFFIDHISPMSFAALHEPILIKKPDLENGHNVDKSIFTDDEKIISFTLHIRLLSENHRPVLTETNIFVSHSDTVEFLVKCFSKPLSRLLAKSIYNPFESMKPGFHFFPFPYMKIMRNQFSKYSFMASHIILGLPNNKKYGSMLAESVEHTQICYGDMSYLVPQTRNVFGLIISFIRKMKRVEKDS